jgi:hypothetical protein
MHRHQGAPALPLLLLALAAPLSAQSSRPASWKVVSDDPSRDSALVYSTMPPGWHLTTGPGAFFFDPAWQLPAGGALEAVVFLFPDSGPAEYGMFLGGADLGASARRVVTVLLRRDGRLGVFRLEGARVDTLLAWTANPAVAMLDGKTDGAVKNVLRVESGAAGVTISVNGANVATLPERAAGMVSGQAGLRVGEKMNLHVSKFEVSGKW